MITERDDGLMRSCLGSDADWSLTQIIWYYSASNRLNKTTAETVLFAEITGNRKEWRRLPRQKSGTSRALKCYCHSDLYDSEPFYEHLSAVAVAEIEFEALPDVGGGEISFRPRDELTAKVPAQHTGIMGLESVTLKQSLVE